MYPSRLFTLKEHRANFESTVYMRNYSIPSLILIFFVMSFIGWFWEVSSHLMLYHSFANSRLFPELFKKQKYQKTANSVYWKHPNVGEGITCLNIYDMYYYL